ncbi:MAG: trypsin-like peptidase domain-containing protein [Candidatus Methylomirabilales bacterium]
MSARGKGGLRAVTTWAVVLTCLVLSPVLAHAKDQFWREGPLLSEQSSDLVRLNRSLTQLVALIQPAVVQIGVEKVEAAALPENHPPVPGERPERPRVGSGFIVSRDGYILTNYHVVAEVREADVELYDGRTFSAKVVGKDRRTDLALLKVDGGGRLSVLPLGDSDRLKIGEFVLAAGNPFGLEHTVTFGVVSRKGHGFGRFGFFDDYIQTDASINPGNSGGPLVNIRGEVVGINTAIIPRQRIGFAIPINLAKLILPQLREHGEVSWGFLGVGIQDLNQSLIQALGMSTKEGALVTNILPGLGAEKAGLERGDVILEFDGTAITDVRTLQQKVARTPAGTKAKIKILRQGKVRTMVAVIGKFNREIEVLARSEESPKPLPKEILGLTLEELTPETAKKFKLKAGKGVVVTEVTKRSAAGRADIRAGDLLAEVDQQPVTSIQEVHRAIKRWTRPKHLLLIQRGDSYFYVAIRKQG